MLVAIGAATLAPAAQALDPARPLGQAKYSSWPLDPGTLPPIITMAQTPDGFLWLATQYGLYRFDGISFEHIPSSGRVSDLIAMILVARDGSLWAAYNSGGVDVYRNGHLRSAPPGAPTGSIQNMVQAPNGDVWVETTGSNGTRFRRFRNGSWNAPADDVVYPPPGVGDLLAARDGSVWAAVGPALIVLRPGARRFAVVDQSLATMASLAEAPDGGIWVADLTGLRRIDQAEGPHAKLSPVLVRLPNAAPQQELLFDRHGVLWNASPQLGIVRVTGLSRTDDVGGAQLDTYRPRNVSRFAPHALLEDSEGDLWVATALGLDRFRPANVARMTEFDGPAEASAPGMKGRFRVMADGAGRIFVRDGSTLWAIDRSGAPRRLATLSSRNDACPAIGPGLWIPDGRGRLTLYEAPTARTVALPIAAPVDICSEDRSGRLLVGYLEHGLWRYARGGWRHIALPPAPAFLPPYLMTPDHAGGVFSYMGRGWISRIDGDAAETIWQKPSVSVGFVNTIAATANGALLGAETGLVHYDGTRFRFLPANRYPFLHDISGIVQTPGGAIWMLSAAGIVRVDSTALDRAFAGRGEPLASQIFQADDGLSGMADALGYPNAVAAADGRIWFATTDGIFWVDPAHLHRNALPPPVFLQRLRAGTLSYAPEAGLALPKGTSRLEIDYTAVSLSMPERVRFRYRMEGVDEGWIEAGHNRQAVYTNLGPGDYRFQVIAANEDGVWNRTGATIAFRIPPTFVQSRAFLILCVFGGIALAGLLYALRMQQITRRLNATMRERMAERERIARDLHDTLLQSVQGLLMRFQGLAYEFPRGNGFRTRIDEALDQTRDTVAEARDRVHDLRSEDRRGSLAEDLVEAARDIFAPGTIAAEVTIEGHERMLAPAACEEIRRIVWEALFNAARHAHAARVDILLQFANRALTVTVSDDGVGIDPEYVRSGGPAGHFGLKGMQERARRLKARLEIESVLMEGTTVTLRVPARIAYVRAIGSWRGNPFARRRAAA